MSADTDGMTEVPTRELKRLLAIEEAVRYALTQRGNAICWRDLYTKLGDLLGVDFTPKLMDDPKVMEAECRRFITSIYAGPYVPLHTTKRLTFTEARAVAQGVFERYKADQPTWWGCMDGTPILNDVAVRMAQAFTAATAEE
jgi:hypothetical protein